MIIEIKRMEERLKKMDDAKFIIYTVMIMTHTQFFKSTLPDDPKGWEEWCTYAFDSDEFEGHLFKDMVYCYYGYIQKCIDNINLVYKHIILPF